MHDHHEGKADAPEHKLTERLKAHHAAGQAVVARALGISVNYATTFPTTVGDRAVQANSAAGQATTAPLEEYIAALAKDAKVCLAGPIAHERYHPHKGKKFPSSWADDIKRVQDIVLRSTLVGAGKIDRKLTDVHVNLDPSTIDSVNGLMDRLKEEAAILVAKHWPAIERVAKALLTTRVLYQIQIDQLMGAGQRHSAEVRADS